MPVIPGTNESQILNPGSPVPIDSSSEKRLAGESMEAFGRGMMALGDNLATAGRQAKAEQDRLTVLTAENQMRMDLLKFQAEQKAAGPIANDETGYGAVEEFSRKSQERTLEIADTIQDNKVKAQFMARSGNLIADNSVNVWADEVKKRGEVNNALLDNLVSSSGAIARNDPRQLDIQLGRTEAAILDSVDLPESQKVIKVQEARRGIVMDAIQGRLGAQNWGQARQIFERNQNVFTVEEKVKQLDKIQQEEWDYNNRSWKQETSNYTREQRKRKDVKNKFLDSIYAAALSGTATPDSLQQQTDQAVEAGIIPQEQAEALTNPKKFEPDFEKTYGSTAIGQAVATGNYDAVLDKVNDERGTKVSMQYGTALRDQIANLQKKEQEDPSFRQKVQLGAQVIDAQAKTALSGPLTVSEKKQIQGQIEQTKSQYFQMIGTNPDQDPAQLSRALVSQVSTVGKVTTNYPDVQAAQSLSDLNKVASDLTKDTLERKQRGNLSVTQEREAARKLQAIEMKKRKLSISTSDPVVNPVRGN